MENSTTTQDAHQGSSLPFEKPVLDILETAVGFMLMTKFGSVEPSHLSLGFLNSEEEVLTPLLGEKYKDLRPSTISESLIEILSLEGPNLNITESDIGLIDFSNPSLFSTDGLLVVQKAVSMAHELGINQVSLSCIVYALFSNPDRFLVEVFQDAGISPSEISEYVKEPVSQGSNKKEEENKLQVFLEESVNLKAFGPVTQAALKQLGRMGASEPEKPLRDVDLIFCFLEQPRSLFKEALDFCGTPVRNLQTNLQLLVGSEFPQSHPKLFKESQVGSLLRRMFDQGARLAESENCLVISESHLIRAHINIVGNGSGNFYERFSINIVGVKKFLNTRNSDREEIDETEKQEVIEDVEAYLKSRVINQDYAVECVVPAIRLMRSGLAEPGQPIGKFLFLGPTGVGKTELSRGIADVVFGRKPGIRDPHLIRIDCGSFTEKEDIVQLLGARQGLVGYKEGQLTNGLQDKPRSVVLFDEAEKAHPHIWQSLLPFFDEGLVHEADGTEYDASQCIIIATSNLGYKEAVQQFDLYGASIDDQNRMRKEIEEFIWGHIESYFSPEFRGRFGRENVIFFNQFDLNSYTTIAGKQIQKVIEEMEGRGFTVSVDEAAITLLGQMAWERRAEGARPVRRLITHNIRNPIVNARSEDPRRIDFSFEGLEGSGKIVLVN